MNGCPGWEVLAVAESWSDEVRAHVDGCAACAAWVREHESFAAGNATITIDERARAGTRLTEFTRELAGVGAPATPAVAATPTGSFFERLLGAFAAPPLRLAGALAVIAIVSVVVVARREPPQGRIGEATRGTVTEPGTHAAIGERGTLALAWPAVEGADGYRVELLDAGLTIVGAEHTSAPACSIDSVRAASAAYVRVVAMRHGDRLRELAPAPIPAR